MPAITAPDFDAFYRDHANWLAVWLRRHARCGHRAADLAQDTFCRLLERPDLSMPDNPRRYLATVARRLLIDDSRRQASERAFLEAYCLLLDGEEAPSPERVAMAVAELAALARLLEELPPKPRRAFLLNRLDGLSYAEISAELGVSVSMVKQYLARALAHCYRAAYGPDAA
ncbi:sigma-70 family RNA polymerase sigma factor [Niveispirillum sp. KHB5.9]|uniref:sigma-70 family RNA polymerase sigma factor n=1 Tax=Niveispirillum sp. KHB5.9 TaxID=3400269 RepID=UPI003A84701E